MGFGSVYGNDGPANLPGHFIVCSSLWVDARGIFLSCWFPPLTGGITFFLRRQEESKQRRRRPWVGAGCAGSLRYSVLAGAAQLGATPLKQCLPFSRQPLRCSAPPKGPERRRGASALPLVGLLRSTVEKG